MSTSSHGLWTINLHQIVELLKIFERHGIELEHFRRIRSDKDFASKVAGIIREQLDQVGIAESVYSQDGLLSMQFGQLGATLSALEKEGLDLSHLCRMREEEMHLMAKLIRVQFQCFTKPCSMKEAVRLLGREKVINGKKASVLWKCDMPKGRIPIKYTRRTIEECAGQNKTHRSDWRLVYVFDWSLRKLRGMVGNNPNNAPNFAPNSGHPQGADWWLDVGRFLAHEIEETPRWAYHLINFKPVGFGSDFSAQQMCMRDKAEHCNAAVFAQAIFAIFMMTGERIAQDWMHWCDMELNPLDPGNYVVLRFTKEGLVLTRNYADRPQYDLGAAAFRKFDY